MNTPTHRVDDAIFDIEDYIGGNVEGVEKIDAMGLTVFLRRTLEVLLHSQQKELLERLLEQTHEGRGTILWEMDAMATTIAAEIERLEKV